MYNLDLISVVKGVDYLLRQRQGICDFTDDPDCVFRTSVTKSAEALRLSDGTVVGEGDPVIELHFWNEHLPPMPPHGPSPGWARKFARQTAKSLFLLESYLDQHSAFDDVAAVSGLVPFGSRLGEAQVIRTCKRFGFELVEPEPDGRMHMVFDSMLLWGLGWAFNRPALRGKGLLRHRYSLWISRATLHARYRDPWPFRAADRH
jgi:hypothetical protein